MSLLDVYVIFAYYVKAVKNNRNKDKPNKITGQLFDNEYVIDKIKEIENYHSSALHWNLKELNENLKTVIDKVIVNYAKISEETGIKLHNQQELKKFKNEVEKDIEEFMNFSRQKAKDAQNREIQTIQPKEILLTATKAKITITNYLGGKYFLTIDEVKIENEKIFIIESKHSNKSILPSKGDVKDGLTKMILFCNLKEVEVAEKLYVCQPILQLTSTKIVGETNSNSSTSEIDKFLIINHFKKNQKLFLETLFTEAKTNKFIVNIQFGEKKDD